MHWNGDPNYDTALFPKCQLLTYSFPALVYLAHLLHLNLDGGEGMAGGERPGNKESTKII